MQSNVFLLASRQLMLVLLQNLAKQEMNKVVHSTAPSSNNVGVQITTITLKETFKCRAADLYRAHTVKEVGFVGSMKCGCCIVA